MTATPPSLAGSEVATETNDLIALSRQKWLWMANRDIQQLEGLFHAQSRFVHMGATMDRTGELDVIRSSRIEYKCADISDISAESIGDTAVV
ncbi:nuclear transport factor 2 family protein [Novosphingobium sp. MMS21-SN21R]|uniref:nuclear transport factor 2 family protein n=1 Tax=Novosphingobium sp. MMS21-SN21R TaxID=2969298 RepID=UPI0028836771|nr:nuclear transport factor 2 family protein [Novosphingobium sp. MMS21-SN21R]MDT0507031.1 nuclear transport factor 2 family protein [Novosphingobium sp. MMS21-SN21R]